VKIYTRAGDRGQTSLLRGGKVRKDDPRIEAYGTVDELNAVIGVVRSAWPESPLDLSLEQVQRDLFDLGALLAAGASDPRFPGVGSGRVSQLEEQIDMMEAELEPLTAFILPGGTPQAAQFHTARTVCRRAERLVVQLEPLSDFESSVTYLNRLSDFLFVAARYSNLKQGGRDTLWKP
jgi:cob(I)alamin adenosyltransferase